MSVGISLLGVGCVGFGTLTLVSGIKTLRSCKSKTIGRITGISESEGRDKDNYRTTIIRRNLNMKSTDESITVSEIPLPNTTNRLNRWGLQSMYITTRIKRKRITTKALAMPASGVAVMFHGVI